MQHNKNFLLSAKEKLDLKQELSEKTVRLKNYKFGKLGTLEEVAPEIPFPENNLMQGKLLLICTLEDEMLWAYTACKKDVMDYDLALEHIRKATELINNLKKF